jgi:hypothetical protein
MNDKPVTNPMLDLSYIRDDDVDFFGIDLADEKSFKLFIRLTENICRRTVEYTLWAQRTKMLACNQNEDSNKDDSSFCPICGLSYEQASSFSVPIKCIPQFFYIYFPLA